MFMLLDTVLINFLLSFLVGSTYQEPINTCFLFSDDGAVRVWRNYFDGEQGSRPSLVTAWTALSGMIPSYRG